MTRPISPSEFACGALEAEASALPALPAFSRTECLVLDIAWREGREAAPSDGRISRLMRRIFGERPQLPLGNPRLEALRQYGMWLCRLGAGAVPTAVTAALTAAGYTTDQIAMLQMTFATFGPGRAMGSAHD